MTERRVPAGLARHGFTGIRDPVPAGRAVGGFAREFAIIFRDEIAARFILGRKPCDAPAAAHAANPASSVLAFRE